MLKHRPQPEADILNQLFQPAHSKLVLTSCFDGLDPAELNSCRSMRRVSRHSSFNVLLRLHLNMRTHLFIHVCIEFALPEQSATDYERSSPPMHGRPMVMRVSQSD